MIEKFKAQKAWKKRNPAKVKQLAQLYYLKNKAKILKYCKKYRKEYSHLVLANRRRFEKLNPWLSHYRLAKSRCENSHNNVYERYGAKGIKFLMTVADFKTLWFRDKAYLMKQASIDREKSTGNYIFSNCRFIEQTENSRRGR